MPWIIEAFADYGLRWNLSKTTVMSTSDMLRSGLGSLSLNHALRECTWSQTLRYLGISLQQPAFDSTEGCTLTELLLPQCKQRVMSGIVQMQSILNGGHWQRWDVSVDLIQTYIASRWLWLSPLLHPNREHLASLQSLQLSILCQTLKLYIPDCRVPRLVALDSEGELFVKFSDFVNLSRCGLWQWHGSIANMANMGTSVIYCEDKLNTCLGKNSFALYINNDRAEPALVKGGPRAGPAGCESRSCDSWSHSDGFDVSTAATL